MQIFKTIRDCWSKIHLVDKCLIIIMAVLLVQITSNMFVGPKNPSETNTIDVVLRTSAAGIFGYFLSANFVKSSDVPTGKEGGVRAIGFEGPAVTSASDTPAGKIGFSASMNESTAPPDIGAIDERPEPLPTLPSNSLQIILAAVLGLYCIMALVVMRNISIYYPHLQESHDVLATISQFRDFVSGCVGFLIGSPSTRNK